MKTRSLLAVTLLLFVNSSCKLHCIVTHLTPRDKSWGNCYDSGQIVIFKSNLGNMDTFKVVHKKEDLSVCNTFEMSDYQYNYFGIELKPLHCTCKEDKGDCKVFIDMFRDEHDSDEMPSVGVFGLLSPTHMFDSYSDGPPYFRLSSVTLSTTGKHYDSAYVIEKTKRYNVIDEKTKEIIPVVLDPEWGCVNSFYWDRQDGLIRYTTPQDEIFEFYTLLK